MSAPTAGVTIMSVNGAARLALLAMLLVVSASYRLTGQDPARTSSKARPLPADARVVLERLVDAVVGGQPPGGDAWLKWDSHFLKGPAGTTYVPYTVTIDEAPGRFRAIAVYVRVLRRGQREGRSTSLVGLPTGAVPVSVPERNFVRPGTPTAGENSAVLASLMAELAEGYEGYPFEDAYSLEMPGGGRRESLRFQRAFALDPGDYDVYVAVRERAAGRGAAPKWAVLKRELTVPDLSSGGLRMSSVILASHVETIDRPLSASEQTLRPYALGTVEIVPAPAAEFRPDETLTAAFLVYNAGTDAQGKPDVTVQYLLYEQSGGFERLLGTTSPQALNAATLPPAFSLTAGHQLAPMHSLPLASYRPGAYRLDIRVIDNLTGARIGDSARFTIAAP